MVSFASADAGIDKSDVIANLDNVDVDEDWIFKEEEDDKDKNEEDDNGDDELGNDEKNEAVSFSPTAISTSDIVSDGGASVMFAVSVDITCDATVLSARGSI
jgi:hypothetical protein